MSEQSGDNGEVSRRSFLGGLIKIVLGTYSVSQGKNQSKLPPAPFPEGQQRITGPNGEVAPFTQEHAVNLLFLKGEPLASYSEFDKNVLKSSIYKQISHIENINKPTNGIQEIAKRLHDLKISESIDHAAEKLKIGKKDANGFIRSFFEALIFVESAGISNQNSGIAKGLAQLQEATALASANRLGISIKPEKDLFSPETNVLLGMEHLKRLYELFPDPGLALWCYHLGEGNMVSALEAYVCSLIDKGRINLTRKQLDTILKDPEGRGSQNLIKTYNISFIQINNNREALAALEKRNAKQNDTLSYVPRILAAHVLLKTHRENVRKLT